MSLSVGVLVRSVFWDRRLGRARVPWLIAIPIIGAYVTLTLVEVLLAEGLPQPVLALVVIGSGAAAAVLLVGASYRFLGAPRSLSDYGLRVDRRWLADLTAGLAAGVLAYAVPMMIALAIGAFTVEAAFDPGDLPLWPGIALIVVACLCTGLWEELLLRGVFITNAVDALRRGAFRRQSVALAILISATVFGLPHLAQPEYPVLILTWVFSGIVFGVLYVLCGNLAFVIGAHATWNIAANALFVRTETPGAAGQSALVRVSHDPGFALLTPGGVLEATGFALLAVLGMVWVLASRGSLTLALPPVRHRQSASRDGSVPVPPRRPVTTAPPRKEAP